MVEDWINAADAEAEAAEKLDPGVFGYVAGGAGDELSLRDNVDAWGRWRLLPRVLTGIGAVTTESELLGAPLSAPVLVAPVAYQRLLDPEGEVAMARAAAAAGTVMCLSTLATARPGEIAAAAPDGRRWFQLYPFRDAGISRALTEEAVEAGFEAVVLTADAPPGGNRERDLRSGFRIPEGLGVPSLAAATGVERAMTIAETFEMMDPGLGWADLERLIAECGVPVLLKGVLAPEDARRAVERGVAGVIVSNHGGRQLDRSLAGADALPEIVEEVAGRAAVLVDGGIRRGVDVAVALALGADAVLVGRAPIWGLAAAGAEGAERVLEILREELALALALCHVPSPAALERGHVRRAPPTSVYSGPVTGSDSF